VGITTPAPAPRQCNPHRRHDLSLVTLDQDGNLMIAHPMMTRLSWTPPVLVGTRLYLRDRRTMMAVELG
jgi:hypothetical protein